MYIVVFALRRSLFIFPPILIFSLGESQTKPFDPKQRNHAAITVQMNSSSSNITFNFYDPIVIHCDEELSIPGIDSRYGFNILLLKSLNPSQLELGWIAKRAKLKPTNQPTNQVYSFPLLFVDGKLCTNTPTRIHTNTHTFPKGAIDTYILLPVPSNRISCTRSVNFKT